MAVAPPVLLSIGADILHNEGCDSNVGGQISMRADDGETFWCSAFQYFDQATPATVARLDRDLNVLEGSTRLAAAMRVHAAVYAARADVDGVVHLHSHHVLALSSTARPLGMYSVSAVLFHGEQVLYADDGDKPHVSVVDELGPHRVAWMKNHGALIVSQSFEQAIVEAVTLEACARVQLDSLAVGGTPLPPAEVAAGCTAYRPHYLAHMWDANVERALARRPDLRPAADASAGPDPR